MTDRKPEWRMVPADYDLTNQTPAALHSDEFTIEVRPKRGAEGQQCEMARRLLRALLGEEK